MMLFLSILCCVFSSSFPFPDINVSSVSICYILRKLMIMPVSMLFYLHLLNIGAFKQWVEIWAENSLRIPRRSIASGFFSSRIGLLGKIWNSILKTQSRTLRSHFHNLLSYSDVSFQTNFPSDFGLQVTIQSLFYALVF